MMKLDTEKIRKMTKKQRLGLEHKIAVSIRFSMDYLVSKSRDLSHCPDYLAADEAWDMLGYMDGEIEDVKKLIASAKDCGLFGGWNGNLEGHCESLERVYGALVDEEDYDDDG